jgi:hypothetical protein
VSQEITTEAAALRSPPRIGVGPTLLAGSRIALFLLVFAGALGARWGRGPDAAAAQRFLPRPDALEYAASAQAIAQSFRFYLAVGPLEIRPRYAPGWPLLLAAAIRVGVPGEELWRVSGLCGACLAGCTGLAAAQLVLLLAAARGAPPHRTLAAALAAGFLAGAAWAVAPVAVAAGSTALSDEPAALFGALALLLSGVAAWAPASPRGYAAACGGGLFFGLVASMRPTSGLLLLPAVIVLGAGAHALRGRGREIRTDRRPRPDRRRLSRTAILWAGAALAVPLLIMGLLVRSGLSPWHWTAYDLWTPRWFAHLDSTFNLRYALRGNTDFERGPNGTPIPNLLYYGKILLGIPGLDERAYLGLVWPAVAWTAGLALAWRAYRQPPGRRATPRTSFAAVAAIAALAALATVACNLALYSLYFFPSGRFILLPLVLPPVILAALLGAGVAAPRRPWQQWLAILGALAWLGSLGVSLASYRSTPASAPGAEDVRLRFTEWQRLPAAVRARTVLPFDPLEAQALGLLPPAVTRRIDAWGTLPETAQVRRLRALGLLHPPLSEGLSSAGALSPWRPAASARGWQGPALSLQPRAAKLRALRQTGRIAAEPFSSAWRRASHPPER